MAPSAHFGLKTKQDVQPHTTGYLAVLAKCWRTLGLRQVDRRIKAGRQTSAVVSARRSHPPHLQLVPCLATWTFWRLRHQQEGRGGVGTTFTRLQCSRFLLMGLPKGLCIQKQPADNSGPQKEITHPIRRIPKQEFMWEGHKHFFPLYSDLNSARRQAFWTHFLKLCNNPSCWIKCSKYCVEVNKSAAC